MTTKELQREIDIYDKDVKELELQQNSDLNTIKFLKQQIVLKEKTLSELQEIPQRLKEEEERNNLEFMQTIKKLETESDDNTKEIIDKTMKEKQTLTKAIKLEQSNLRAITQKRDELKNQYEWLKEQITKLINTNELL